jgi:predicted metal-dependent hydrolase
MFPPEPNAMTDLPAVPSTQQEPAGAAALAAPASLPVRRLRVDLARGFDRLWNGGNAFRTHYFNALSMSFPVGEQFFIDSVRAGAALLPAAQQPGWSARLRGFIGQEATHRFLHSQYNAELERQGLRNRWQHWAQRRIERAAHLHPLNHVAVTAAYEHFTAVLSRAVLTRPDWLAGASPELALVWRWHAVEESEHKAVAFDLYRAMGGSERRRILWFVYISAQFLGESMVQTWLNLWHSGLWWRPTTWAQGLRFLYGWRGAWWTCLGPLTRYLKPGFHPDEVENATEMAQWLEAQRSAYTVVGE